MGVELNLLWQPKQWQLWKLVEDSLYTHIGFGGSKGGGKSEGGRNVILGRAMKYPGTAHMIFRRTFDELWSNHIQKYFQRYPITRSWYNAQHKQFTVPTGRGKPPSTIDFVYAEHKDDVYKHQGKEWATQLRDEATHLNQDEHVFLNGCNRYVGPLELTPKVLYTTNPGRNGHDYIKRLFVDQKYESHEDASAYTFIRSFCWDNIGWFEKELSRDGINAKQFYSWTHEKRFEYFITRTAYGRELNAQPETERLQYLMGDWDVFEGQFFSEFRRDLHLIKPFRIPAFWERFAAADWGYSSPACNLWFAVSPDEWLTISQVDGRKITLPPRTVVVYRESYVRKLTSVQLGELWKKQTGGDSLRYRLLDPAFGPTRGGGISVAEEMRPHWSTANADNDRLQGWSRVRHYLAWRRSEKTGVMEQFPHLYIFDTCTNLARTLPQQTYDEHVVEDLDTQGEDHAVDALRYGLMSRQPITIEPLDEMEQELVEAEMRAKHRELKQPS